MIRFSHIRAKNLGVLRDIDVDLDAIPGTLVAVTGPNGSGKSTFLGCLAAGLYREAPTRGSLVDLARSRDASLEVSFVNGTAWTVRHLVDGVGKKSEASALDAEGKLATDSGKVRAFDAWAAAHLPPAEVLLSSTFLPQGSRGFLGLSAGERKGVLLRVLGVERLERLADSARENLRAAKAKLDVVRGKLAEVEAGADVAGAEARVTIGASRVEELQGAVGTARAAVEREERALAAAEALWARAEQHAKDVAAAESDRDAARAKAKDLGGRIANNREILERAAEIRAAVAQEETLRAELATLKGEAATHDAATIERTRRRSAAVTLIRAAEARQKRAAGEVRSETDRSSELEQLITSARAEIEAVRPQIEHHEAEILRLSAEVEGLRGRHVAGLGERVVALRQGLVGIVARGEEPATASTRGPSWQEIASFATETAKATVARDDAAELAAVEVPAKLVAAESALTTARNEVALLSTRLQRAERHAERVGDLPEILRRKAVAEAELARATTEIEEQARERDAVDPDADTARAAELFEKANAIAAQLEALKPLLRNVEPLARAEARIAELEPQLADAYAADRAALARLAEIGAAPEASHPDRRAIDGAKASLADAEQLHRSAEIEQGAKLGDLDRARAAAERFAALDAERVGLDADVADWTRLAEDLGRDGLQAAEIDAAGPELTELVNDLLHTCVGPRWTVTVDTQRLSADGKRVLEGLEVRVLDVERGREAPAETLSGGELVLVGEAVSLAITMLACRRAGVRGATLIRDESGAALDPGAARSYVAMLRRAATLVGARQVLFVTHAPEVVDMADARIVLAAGKAVVS